MKKNSQKPARSLKRMFPSVTSVVDARHPVTVHVKTADCTPATPLDMSNCAMARAAKREFKVDDVVIGLTASYLIKGKKAIRFKTPQSVQREIVSFDRHKDFQPGTYDLVPVSPALRLGASKKGGRKAAHSSHAPKRVRHKTANVRVFRA